MGEELYLRAWHFSLAAKVPSLKMPASHMSAGSSPGFSTSYPAPCLFPGKTAEDVSSLWDPALTLGTRRKLLAPNFESAKPWPLWPFWEVIQKVNHSLSLSV